VLQDRVEIIEAKTRTPGSPYYQINPSGRVPYLIDGAGVGMEDSQLICTYLDRLDGKPRFHDTRDGDPDWAYLRLEAAARSLCDGISVWSREMHRPEIERSPTVLAHEVARGQRIADAFEARATKRPRMTSRTAPRNGAPRYDSPRYYARGYDARRYGYESRYGFEQGSRGSFAWAPYGPHDY
jgi:glutathione S-transferase